MSINVRLLVRAEKTNEGSEFLARTVRSGEQGGGGRGLERIEDDVGDILSQQGNHSMGTHLNNEKNNHVQK